MKSLALLFFFVPCQLLEAQIAKARKLAMGAPHKTKLINHFAAGNNWRMAIYYTMQLGDSAQMVGDLATAEKQYMKALEYTEKIVAKGGPYRNILLESAFDPYERLARIYLQSNNLRRADLYFTKAKDEKQKYLPRHSVFKVSPYIGLGRVQFMMGNYQEASLAFSQAEKLLNSATTSGYDFGIPQREILLNQYELLMKERKYKEAYRYLKKMSFGGQGEQVPRIFQLKADYFLQMGDHDQCQHYLTKAKLYSRNIALSTVNFKILRTEALLYWTQQKTKEAGTTFNKLVESYQKYIHQNFASMTEYERESFYSLLRDDFDLYNAFVIEASQKAAWPLGVERLLDNQLFSKALLLNEINKLKDRIRNSGNQELKNYLVEWEMQKALLSSLYFAKRRNVLAITEAEARIEVLEQRLNTQTLQAASRPRSWKEVQATLNIGEAAIEIIRIKKFALTGPSRFEFDDRIAYVVVLIDSKSTTPNFVVIENGNDLETKYLNYYRNCINSRVVDTLSYRQFWLPVQKMINGQKKIYVSSDGVYNQINLSALFNPTTQNYLLDEVDLALLTNTKDLLRPVKNVNSRDCYLYARPDYKADSVGGQLRDSNPANRSIATEAMEQFREQEFEDLPGTEQEIIRLEKLLQQTGWRAQIRLGDEASEGNIKATFNPAVLHIATHGFFLKVNEREKINSMIRSGIILAGVNNNDDLPNDGVLTAYEATNLQLDSTFLVVLSACETGLGDVKNGEGVYGLQRGFVVAGTRYLLMSLWKIDDAATALLMEQVYVEWLKSGNLPAAVKVAQIMLRQLYPHPYFWGSFILLGN
jgi:CHAT domain-containing protein